MKRAYTLIETVAVMLLVGVLVLSATVALVPMAEAFLQAKQNADALQKVGLATARITRELTTITNVVSGTDRVLRYDHLDEQGLPRQHVLAWSGAAGAPLLLDNVILLDDVQYFELRYYGMPGEAYQSVWTAASREIEVGLGLRKAPGAYTLRIRPRNVP
jgi:hypothetical protein